MTQLSSRAPFNDDQEPYRCGQKPNQHVRHERGDVWTCLDPLLDPRPEFDRPQTNSTNLVLADLRDYWKHHGSKLTARHAAAYLDICDIDAMDVPAEHIAHAREVLKRLAPFARAEAAA